jgi:2-polyprenyl-3-methyl-5-hydroxy-6-metoxy-1,4-benzoquinol methylase
MSSSFDGVVQAWNEADPVAIHPLRQQSEEAYWASGVAQAQEVISLVPEGAYVIDFGCGDGRLAIPMHRAGLHVLAVDASAAMLNRLREYEPEIATHQSTGETFEIPLGWEADAVVCRAVLIHHGYNDVARLVKKFATLVKPGGLLIADWPVAATPRERDHWIDVTTWDRSIRDTTADLAGWEPVEVENDPTIWRRKHDDIL